METHPGEGGMKEEKFPHSRKCSHRWVCGEFWNLRGQHNQEGEKMKQNKITTTKQTQKIHLTATAREVVQTLTSATS